jgi:hypothetical protein
MILMPKTGLPVANSCGCRMPPEFAVEFAGRLVKQVFPQGAAPVSQTPSPVSEGFSKQLSGGIVKTAPGPREQTVFEDCQIMVVAERLLKVVKR